MTHWPGIRLTQKEGELWLLLKAFLRLPWGEGTWIEWKQERVMAWSRMEPLLLKGPGGILFAV